MPGVDEGPLGMVATQYWARPRRLATPPLGHGGTAVVTRRSSSIGRRRGWARRVRAAARSVVDVNGRGGRGRAGHEPLVLGLLAMRDHEKVGAAAAFCLRPLAARRGRQWRTARPRQRPRQCWLWDEATQPAGGRRGGRALRRRRTAAS